MREVYTYFDGKICPVDEFIKQTDSRIKRKLDFCIEYIRNESNCFSVPYIKHFSIAKYSMFYEFRVKAAGKMVRIIFYEKDKKIYLLYAFYKRDRKDTEKALNASLKLLNSILENGEIKNEFRKGIDRSD